MEYRIPVNGSVFLNTNITYASNTTYLNQFAGSLYVAVNDDVSVPDGVVHVTMHHSSPQLGNSTNVCLMHTGQGGGLYIFVRSPHLLTPDQYLTQSRSGSQNPWDHRRPHLQHNSASTPKYLLPTPHTSTSMPSSSLPAHVHLIRSIDHVRQRDLWWCDVSHPR